MASIIIISCKGIEDVKSFKGSARSKVSLKEKVEYSRFENKSVINVKLNGELRFEGVNTRAFP